MNFKILTSLTQLLLFLRISFALNCFNRSSDFFRLFCCGHGQFVLVDALLIFDFDVFAPLSIVFHLYKVRGQPQNRLFKMATTLAPLNATAIFPRGPDTICK